MRYSLALMVSLFIVVSGRQGWAGADNTRPPNVILILADDMTVGDLSFLNNGRTSTPNLDRLAEQSVYCEQAYSASCVCAPARAALLTGRYPHRTGVVTLNMYNYPKLTRLRHDETTIAEIFRANGYATGLVGKWHCGMGKGYEPRSHGFDEFEGFSGADGLSYFKYQLTTNDQKVTVTDQYLTEDLTERAIGFIRRHHEQPFFLHLAHYAPHRPLEAPEELIETWQNRGFDRKIATIYAMIQVMDRGIGELLYELERLKLADDTIVIFASDNGQDPLTGSRFNHELRGAKYEIYEGGIRVPLMFHWPGRLQPRRTSSLIHFVDIMPTVLDLCDISIPDDVDVDGVSHEPWLVGSGDQVGDEVARFWQWNRGTPNYTHNAAVRKGNWKLIRPYVTRAVNPPDSQSPPALYDLATDPFEMHDLSSSQPDKAAQLSEALTNWTQSIEHDRTRPVSPSE